MKNITLSINESLLREARRYAAEHDTTVNAIVREHLVRLVGQQSRSAQARKELLRLSRESTWDPGQDWKWNRDEIYDRPGLHGHERPRLRGVAQSARRGKKASGK